MNFKVKLMIVLFVFYSSFALGSERSQKLHNLVDSILASKNKNIDIASKASENKILSQMITKDIVLLVANVSKKYYYKELVKSTRKFNENLNYIKKQQLNEESRRDFNEVEEVWKDFLYHIKTLYKNGKIDSKRYQYILDNNEKLLRLSHKLMQSIQSQNMLNLYSSKIEEHTIKFADRERMLTQKMFKEKFLIFIKKDTKRNRIRLRGSFILFENALKALVEGDRKRGIVPVSNKKIRKKILAMKKEWLKVRKYYKEYRINTKAMLALIKADRKLYKLSDEIVKMIENSTELY